MHPFYGMFLLTTEGEVSLLLSFRWLKTQEEKLPEDSNEDTIASLKEKEGKIAVSVIMAFFIRRMAQLRPKLRRKEQSYTQMKC